MDELSVQLSQMKAALTLASEEDKPGIQAIIDQLEELVGCASTGNRGSGEVEEEEEEEEEDEEYKIFQAEIAALSGTNEAPTPSRSENVLDSTGDCQSDDSSSAQDVKKSIGDELEALIGMKCKAPHQESWGQIGYYSAMISSVLSLEGGSNEEDTEQPHDLSSIMVRVIFMQPVVKSQLLCPFYKEDRCRFSDQDCKYSHGEVVPLAQLREYTETDYSAIVPGSRVLAKYHDDLWYKATVQRITDDGECEVSYDVGNEALTIPLHETSLLDENGGDDDLSSSSEDDIENPGLSTSSDSEDDIPKSLLGGANDGLLNMKGESALGDWERYTKGIGSRLMMKMGYVMGTGLGKLKEGRVEPVDAIVLPPGKSLDACMALKEKAKDGNLFSAEKRRLKQQRREQKQREKQTADDKLKEKKAHSMFDFLNDKLALRKTNVGNSTAGSSNECANLGELHKQSSVSLNKRALGVHENLRQVTKDIQKTKQSMKRQQGRDKEAYSVMEKKLADLERRKSELDRVQNRLANEQKQRSDKRKLTLF